MMTKTKTSKSAAKSRKKRKPPKLSRVVKPDHLSIEDWQIELRRQFGPASSVEDAPAPEPNPVSGVSSVNGNGSRGASAASDEQPERAVAIASAPGNDVWSGLLQSGLTFLEQLATASRGGSQPSEKIAPAISSLVDRDARTGENFLRIPMPKPEILDKALGAISALLERFRK